MVKFKPLHFTLEQKMILYRHLRMLFFQSYHTKWFLIMIIFSVPIRSNFSLIRVNIVKTTSMSTDRIKKNLNKIVIMSVIFIGPNLDILYSLLTKACVCIAFFYEYLIFRYRKTARHNSILNMGR